ncbi:LysR family transcriptional regulator [Aeromicrobium ginsengisoli]|uniref:LysR family transcriptional regulator n=1 Tax=Aeromicrobium ginsengisoli TaxID=363867 RepID=A0A5M4FJ22_9ACTN|nr:LysR substrate-binding domain-containing protein [Aeromicrobium ginsengisoli]KAA1399585.1 LysR family transcriptional regulator [Aeromicrobium ginsengisoli]
MADLDLRRLRYFLVLADELHYGRAAERLHIAQPVLSRQISVLERELGVDLFERSKQGTVLSEAGQALLERARGLVESAGALQRQARRMRGRLRRLVIGFMPGLIVTPVVRLLNDTFPELVVDVVRTSWDDQVTAVQEGRIDVSFVRLPVAGGGLTVIPLFEEPRVVALPVDHPLAAQPEVVIGELAPLNLLQPADAVPEWRDLAHRLRPAAGIPGSPPALTVEEKLEIVASGRGIVVLPESTAQYYHRPDIAYRSIADIGPSKVGLAFEAARTEAEIEAVSEIAVQLFARAADVVV